MNSKRQKTVYTPGQRVGRLTLQEYISPRGWKCLCDCGNVIIVAGGNLKANTRSCGCLRQDWCKTPWLESTLPTVERTQNHFSSNSPEYLSWVAMIGRCYNPNNGSYPRYGGRGIKVCEPWLQSFEQFQHDMGLMPEGCSTVERIDNDTDYCPENCLWSPRLENKKDTHLGKLTEPGRLKQTPERQAFLREQQKTQREATCRN